MRHPSIHRRCLFVALALLVPVLAGAQPVAPSVEDMLREGIAHRVAGRDEAAVERFEAAYAAQRAPVTAGQLALGCQAVGRWVDADRYMREALAAPDDDWVRRHRRELDEAYAVVRRNVGELELRGGPDGATVRVDGAEVATLPLAAPLRLRAGVVTLEVRAEGHFPFTRQVSVLGGELTREPVALTPLPREPAPPVAAAAPPTVAPPAVVAPPVVIAPREEPRVPVASWVLGGVGVALVAGGAVALGIRDASAGRFNASCPLLVDVPRAAQSSTCREELSIGDWTLAGAIVGLGGGALTVGAAVAVAVWPRRAGAARAAWACAPTMGGATCAVSF